MENTLSYGYSSEKVFTGLLANTVPVYFGNKEVADLINLDRIVYCKLPDEEVHCIFDIHSPSSYRPFTVIVNQVVSLREQWWTAQKDMKRELGVNPNLNPDDNRTLQFRMDPLVRKWAVKSYGPFLQKCIDEVIAIDQNDTLYKWKLKQHIVPGDTFKNSHYDGTVLTDSLIEIMRLLKSPLFD